MSVTRDCNCPVPRGHVKAERVKGFGAGKWGSARAGDVVMVPREVVDRNPELWEVLDQPAQAPESAVEASDDLSGLTAPELTALAEERGVTLPSKARKADIVGLLNEVT